MCSRDWSKGWAESEKVDDELRRPPNHDRLAGPAGTRPAETG